MNAVLRRILLVVTISLSMTGFPQRNQAQNSVSSYRNQYQCIERNGIPTTVVNTQRGKIELIAWKSNTFSGSGWTPQRRCQEITKRFQAFSDRGSLRFISHGFLNGYNIICVAEKINNTNNSYKCTEDIININGKEYDGTLITLEPQDDPIQLMKQLFNTSARIKYGGITIGSKPKDPYMVNGQYVINLETFLDNSTLIP